MLNGAMNQKAVHWVKNAQDGYGQTSYSQAVSLDVRWQESSKLFISQTGKEETSQHVVYAETSIEFDDYLWLGDLTSLSAAQKADPTLVTRALPVRGRNKSYDLQGNIFVSKVFL
jgi:hypothetical protein